MLRTSTAILASGAALTLLAGCRGGGGTTAPAPGSPTASKVAEHAVTGSGSVGGNFPYQMTYTAQRDSTGTVRGEFDATLDLSNDGKGIVQFKSTVDCLDVQGNTAWIGSHVTSTSNSFAVTVGTNVISEVVDGGPGGQDYTDGDFSTPNVKCTDHPPGLILAPLISGDLVVR